MKRNGLVAGLLILLAGILVSSCSDYWPELEQIMKGAHKLRKMTERTELNSRVSASFFLIVGNVSSKTTSETLVKFAWEMNDGTYALSSLPLERIRVKLDEKATTPTIEFRLVRFGDTMGMLPELQRIMNRHVNYAIVTAKESDWPVKINLPLNSP
ncbi:MAG: hypothetical protein HYY92_01320 [Parcubacteria group bacterium]|nr:hypothetical protein [Parcubacteria group bacterium]